MAKRTTLAQQMFEHAARQRESGMTVANYAQQYGITRTKLQYWIRKSITHEAANDSSLRFINLGSFGKAKNPAQGKDVAEPVRTPQITLTFPNGMCLKIY
jgi:acetyl-CoA acetyltransferase